MIANPEISIDYSLTYREFVIGYKLGARQSIATFIYSFLIRYVATTAAIALSLLIVFGFLQTTWTGVSKLLPAAACLWLAPIWVWRSWRTSYKQLISSRLNGSELTFQADRTSFARRIIDKGELTWLWSATAGIAKNKSMLLIVVRKGAFIMIPRRAISDEQISLLEEMLRQGKSTASC